MKEQSDKFTIPPKLFVKKQKTKLGPKIRNTVFEILGHLP